MHLWLLIHGGFAISRSAARIALVAVVMLAASSPALALVVESQAGTTVAPPDDPGWDNFTLVGRNYIYLGNSWALSARHVGPTIGDPPSKQNLTFSTGTFSTIPNQNFVVHNPDGSGLTTETDLRLVRINGDPGLPSIFDGSAPFTLPTQAPPLNGEVVFMGNGRSREASQTHWDSSWTEVASGGMYHGYKAMEPNDDTKRWGKNRLANANNYSSSGAFTQILSATTGVLSLKTGDNIRRDIASLVTSFDQSGLTNETQAVANDSGSAVFYKRGGQQWELTGIVNAIFTFEDQPGLTAVYGDATTIADLSFYRDEIFEIIDENQNYSILGDINLDGEVSGNGSGSWATDDVTAFVEGWGYDNEAGAGDYTSWINGDLNLDGNTNVYDFYMLRNALQSTGSAAGVSSLNEFGGSVAGVPEPAAILLALFGAGLLAMRQRRPRYAVAD